MSWSSAARRRSRSIRSSAPARRRRPSRSGTRGRSGGTSTATWRRRSPRTRRRSGRAGRRRRRCGRSSGSQRRGRPPASDVPERGVVADRREAPTSSGSNQAPLRRAATSYAARGPPAAWKISAVWAKQRIRASSGISSPRSPRGCPPPSQCSSSARIASAVSRSKPDHARDLGPALAARLHQRVGHLPLVLDRQQPLRRAADAAAGRDRADRPQERGQPARPVDRASTCASRRGRRRRTAPPSWPSWPSSRRPSAAARRRGATASRDRPRAPGRGASRSCSCGRRGRPAPPR